MGFQIPITNCSYSGLWRPLVWTAFSVTPAIRPACRLSSSLESKSVRLPSNMARSSDNHSSVLRTCPVMRLPRVVAGELPITAIAGEVESAANAGRSSGRATQELCGQGSLGDSLVKSFRRTRRAAKPCLRPNTTNQD
jgi:hypothetical protein